MGIKLFSGSSDYPDYRKETKTTPNPNKFHFTVLEVMGGSEYVLVKAKYPDATTYGGTKLLLMKRGVFEECIEAKELDPHFLENDRSPIARFAPSEEGWKIAIELLESLDSGFSIWD